jgi:membrane protein YqaA with SNARE-associated domain
MTGKVCHLSERRSTGYADSITCGQDRPVYFLVGLVAISYSRAGQQYGLSNFFRPLFAFFVHTGYFGPLLLGVLDSSFLFLPFGNDILVVILVARHHQGLPFYVLAAATGSTIGVIFLDLVARKLGEEGIKRMAGEKRFETLRKKVGSRAGWAVVLASLVPPPFPFTMVIATASALKYPRLRLFLLNWIARAVRFTIIGFLALEFGRQVISVANSAAFRYTIIGFVILCLIGSGFSIWNWIRHTRSGRAKS